MPRKTKTVIDPSTKKPVEVPLTQKEISNTNNSRYFDRWRRMYEGYTAWKNVLAKSGMPSDSKELLERIEKLKGSSRVTGKGTAAVEPYLADIMSAMNDFRSTAEMAPIHSVQTLNMRRKSTTEGKKPDETSDDVDTSALQKNPFKLLMLMHKQQTDREKVYLAQQGKLELLQATRTEERDTIFRELRGALVQTNELLRERIGGEQMRALVELTEHYEGRQAARECFEALKHRVMGGASRDSSASLSRPSNRERSTPTPRRKRRTIERRLPEDSEYELTPVALATIAEEEDSLDVEDSRSECSTPVVQSKGRKRPVVNYAQLNSGKRGRK